MNRYELQSGILRICDEELGIDLNEPYDSSKFSMQKEPKGEGVYHLFCLLKDQLHGPSIFYDSKGTILSSSWYYQGARIGKVRQYYPTGILYATLGFKGGKREGEHRYYYPNGAIRTLMHYTEGSLDKEITLYWPNGQKKRHLYLFLGKKQGMESFWDESGKLVKEISHAS